MPKSESILFVCKSIIFRLFTDSAYTERYMGTPNSTGNSKSYEDADLTKRAPGFKDKMLFLVHGSADDNVHIQQTMMFVKAMADEGVPFRQLVRVLLQIKGVVSSFKIKL